MANQAQRFLQRVNQDGGVPEHAPELGQCHVWTAGASGFGYGKLRFMGKVERAHRVAFFLAHGRWPEPCCLHRCDNPSCVNPEHLFEGTRSDNATDKVEKRRQSSTLTEQDVRDIRANYALCRVTQKDLAGSYGVNRSTIHDVVRNHMWRHV